MGQERSVKRCATHRGCCHWRLALRRWRRSFFHCNWRCCHRRRSDCRRGVRGCSHSLVQSLFKAFQQHRLRAARVQPTTLKLVAKLLHLHLLELSHVSHCAHSEACLPCFRGPRLISAVNSSPGLCAGSECRSWRQCLLTTRRGGGRWLGSRWHHSLQTCRTRRSTRAISSAGQRTGRRLVTGNTEEVRDPPSAGLQGCLPRSHGAPPTAPRRRLLSRAQPPRDKLGPWRERTPSLRQLRTLCLAWGVS
jgi:hypothetical protein